MKSVLNIVVLSDSSEECREIQNALSKNIKIKLNYSNAEKLPDFVKLLNSVNVDAFILDWNFAECKVLDLIEKLKNSQKFKRLPIFCIDKNYQKSLTANGVDLFFKDGSSVVSQIAQIGEFLSSRLNPIIPESYQVLIVDNNPDVLEIMDFHMKSLNHKNYETANSVANAKIKISEKHFDLLLLDWNLEDGTCIDLIEHLRIIEKQTKKNSKVLVITGRNSVDDIMTLLKYDVKDHLIKPFDYNELEDAIKYTIERSS